MSTDRAELLERQYRTAENLQTRIALHERFSTNPQPFPHWIFERLPFADRADILELGCGNGNLWHSSRDRIPSGWRLTLTDLSPGMVEAARARLGDLDGRATYQVVDAQALPFADRSFDGVIANHMLFHVPDRDLALTEIARVLRPGGVVTATTNGVDHLRELSTFRSEQWALKFGLETGPPQVERFFDHVEVEHFRDSLEVTEVEPLLGYVRSLHVGDAQEDIARLAETAEAAIARDGAFRVTKSAGLLRARKP